MTMQAIGMIGSWVQEVHRIRNPFLDTPCGRSSYCIIVYFGGLRKCVARPDVTEVVNAELLSGLSRSPLETLRM